ncbi:MAG: sigma-70 family RNA polymerase sigma factor [Acidimicrobiia bacterium]|nr:sigma-70 family RNA polymerase sigma factor [Acidimicrobiia bacterium]
MQNLLKRVASHDRDAFQQLYSATSARVFGIVLKVVRDRRMSEEVTQEVYLEIWRTAPRFDPARGSGIGWMLMLAHSRAVDRVRYEERQISCLPLEDSSCDTPIDAGDTDELEFDLVPLRSAVAKLPAQQRTVVALAFYQGLSHRQVAEQLDIPLGTMKTRMRRALIKLRSTLA